MGMWMLATFLHTLSVFYVIETSSMDPAVFVDAPCTRDSLGNYLLISWRGKGDTLEIEILDNDFSVKKDTIHCTSPCRYPLKNGTFLSYRISLLSQKEVVASYTDRMWVEPITAED